MSGSFAILHFFSGARKWQVSLDMDAAKFHCALLNIYPRLAGSSNYNLWTLRKDKTLEKLPPKVNTPSRIRAYFGSFFTGCIIIMPAEEIPMGPVVPVPNEDQPEPILKPKPVSKVKRTEALNEEHHGNNAYSK